MRQCHVLLRKVIGTSWPPSMVIHRGVERSLADVFAEGGIALHIEYDPCDLPDSPRRFPFGLANLHDWMLLDRRPATLEAAGKEWFATVLIVPHIAYLSGTILRRPLGVMFDVDEADRHRRPREGCAVAYRTVCDDARIFFRTVAHELGHVFNLLHPPDDDPPVYEGDTLMFETCDLAQRHGYPDNMSLAFSDANCRWLREGPDDYVRPGGEPFGARPGKPYSAPSEPTDHAAASCTVSLPRSSVHSAVLCLPSASR